MATYSVTKVRKETVRSNAGSSHEHIIGVITNAGTYYANKEVVDSIAALSDWYTSVEGQPKAKIREMAYCPKADCYHKPYLTTEADSTAKNNLENLPRG